MLQNRRLKLNITFILYISVTISIFLATISRRIVTNVSKSLFEDYRSILSTNQRLFVTGLCNDCYEKSSISRHFCYDNGVLRKVDEKSTKSRRFVTKCYEKSTKSRRLLRYFPLVCVTKSRRFATKSYEKSTKSRRLLRDFPPVS